ncbi:unnamed protein product, partial [Ectocarpus sp. 8 AP-2014]
MCRPRSPLVCRADTVHQALQDLLWSLLRVPNVRSHPCWETASGFLVPEDESQRRSDLADILERCISSCHNSAELPASLEVVRHMLERNVDLKYVHRLLRLRTRAGVPQTTKSESRQDGSPHSKLSPTQTFRNIEVIVCIPEP